MKELDSFTVEEIEEIISSCQQEIHNTPTSDEFPVSPRLLLSLARIALAAKRAEPVAWKWRGAVGDIWTEKKERADFVTKFCPELPVTELYTTPQLNSPEIPQGWIKCSDRMPENDEFVLIWPLPDFGVDLHVGQYIKFHKKGPGWFAQVSEQNYGVEFYPITVTHWMTLPAAPESE
ncbi:DUF551 domain-containing protein [Yersinia sp. 2545 StPb PI]|uniref:DUF551 domain-containing protein n=1 Tax=Yersinia sp. 2545 StPb PI TaxID=3117410 RepID=UPI003FA46E2F